MNAKEPNAVNAADNGIPHTIRIDEANREPQGLTKERR
ncbi:hypothetical protein J2T17_002535 [Paenibacillus mucilaginosus]